MAEQDVLDKLEDVLEKCAELETKIGEMEQKVQEDRVVYTLCSGCNATGDMNPAVGCEACGDTPGFRVHGKSAKVGG